MAEAPTKLPVKSEPMLGRWEPFESIRREIDRAFDQFQQLPWRLPFGRSTFDLAPTWPRVAAQAHSPAVDVVASEKEYKITVELPGLDENNVEVNLSNGVLTIKGEKKEEKEEREKDYYIAERHYGAFQRSFQVPDAVDSHKIAASFKSGVLTVTLPKTTEAQKSEKRITVNAA